MSDSLIGFKDFLIANQDKKNPFQQTTSLPQCPSGYMYLDYGTGSYLTVTDEHDNPEYVYHNIGFTTGSVNSVISKSQGGKTSLMIAIGAAIIEPYLNPMLYASALQHVTEAGNITTKINQCMPFIQIMDTEKTLPIDYAKKVARYTNAMCKAHINIDTITTDKDLIKAVAKHVEYKAKHMVKVPMHMLDIFGDVVWQYPPTVIIIDSASQLLMEDVDDPLSGAKSANTMEGVYHSATQNTAGARKAKIITAMYSQLVNYAKRYNIIIFSINHINKQLPVNGIPTKQYRGLRAGETIGGGEKAIYLSANILRLDVIKSVDSDKPTSLNLGEGVTGHVTIAKWIKCKSNSKSNESHMIYTNEAGYDPMLSNLYSAKERGELTKSGNSFIVKGYDKNKFTLKNYRDVFGENPDLIGAYYDEMRNTCAKLLDNPDKALLAHNKLVESVRNDIHEEFADDKNEAMDMDDLFAMTLNE